MRWPLVLLAACEPTWGVHVDVRDPVNHPIEDATVTLDCRFSIASASVRSTPDGHVLITRTGWTFPSDCDVTVTKPGFREVRLRHKDFCGDPTQCGRVFHFDIALQPASS